MGLFQQLQPEQRQAISPRVRADEAYQVSQVSGGVSAPHLDLSYCVVGHVAIDPDRGQFLGVKVMHEIILAVVDLKVTVDNLPVWDISIFGIGT